MQLDYKPPGPVAKAFMKDRSFVRGLRGPVGSGKSVASCMELMRIVREMAGTPPFTPLNHEEIHSIMHQPADGYFSDAEDDQAPYYHHKGVSIEWPRWDATGIYAWLEKPCMVGYGKRRAMHGWGYLCMAGESRFSSHARLENQTIF